MSTLCQSQLATKHDILIYYKGGETPNGDTKRAVPHGVEKIFGYLDQDTLTQARAVSKEWRCYVDTKTPYWKIMTREIIPNSGTSRKLRPEQTLVGNLQNVDGPL